MPRLINKNLDGIRNNKPIRQSRSYYIVPQVQSHVILPQKTLWPRRLLELGQTSKRKIYFALLMVALLSAFGSGMMVALRTPKSEAETALTKAEPANYEIPLNDVQVVAPSDISNDVLFNTPLQMLQDYLANKNTPDVLSQRKAKLKAYLEGKKSPFVDEVDTIAEQDHWKLILAISFAESTLGKRCYYNNCSGIGGSNIRTYKNLKGWILDFNRLLEKRYKDQTLEQMCGVYVQPCNPNWLLATKQILSELKEAGVE